MSARVLVVDDEVDLCRLIHFHLSAAGFDVEWVTTGYEAIARGAAQPPAIAIVDIMLPDLDGTEVCRTLRSQPATSQTRIVLLTAKGGEQDRLRGFETGADDYVVKPFSMQELVMRVQALTRRMTEANTSGPRVLIWQNWQVDLDAAQANIAGVAIPLRPLELKLLALFVSQPERLFRRGELLEAIWHIRPDTNTRTVDVHVRRLRARLGAAGAAIQTVHGLGYRLRAIPGEA